MRRRQELPPPSLAELATYPTHGTTVLCTLGDRGVSFTWPMLINRHGLVATWGGTRPTVPLLRVPTAGSVGGEVEAARVAADGILGADGAGAQRDAAIKR